MNSKVPIVGTFFPKTSNHWNFFVPAAALIWGGTAIASPAAGKWLAQEDGLLQWVQFALLFAASVVFLLRSRRSPHIILLLALSAFSFFVAMEEISWGQRVFHFITPPALDHISVQDEFTIHNLMGLQRIRHWGLIVFAIAGARYLPESFRPALATIFLAGFSREITENIYAMCASDAAFAARFWAGRFCEIGELGVAFILFLTAVSARLDKDLFAGIPSRRKARDRGMNQGL